MKEASLISVESGEIHPIVQGRKFDIGRGAASVVHMLQIDSDSISRRHACILYDNEQYFLYDYSKNGTCVNSCLIDQGKKTEITAGDLISFSGYDYFFKLNEDSIIRSDNLSAPGKLTMIDGRQTMEIRVDESKVCLYQLKMLMHNPDYGFLKIKYTKTGNCYAVYYDLEGYITLDCFLYHDTIKRGDELTILYNILMGCRKADALLLNARQIYLKSNGIYIDPKNLTIKLLYLPSRDSDADLYEELISITESFERQADELVLTDLHEIKMALDTNALGLEALSVLVQRQEATQRQLYESDKRNFAVKPSELTPQESFQPQVNAPITKNRISQTLNARQKLFLIQVLIGLGLIGIYFLGIVNTMDYMGFLMLVLGLDLWAIKSLHLI